MKNKILTNYFYILICVILSSCSGTRLLPNGEKLYTGAEIKIITSEKIDNPGFIKKNIRNSLSIKPNKRFLGMRPKLWMYLKAGEEPKSKFKKWLKRNGEAPVFINNLKPGISSAIIDAKLFNIGIFKCYTEYKILDKKRTAKIIYISHIHKPYTIKELKYQISDNPLNNIILSEKENSLINSGENYNLDKLKNERLRIDALLKKNGYFYFNPDFLIFKADTSNIDNSITLRLMLKDSVNKKALTIYRINKVFIDQEYSLEENTDLAKDSFHFQNNIFTGKKTEMIIKPKVILRSVYLKKHDNYSREKHNITLNRLMSMGNFKFVRMNFTDSDTSASGYLDVNILMTPLPKQTFRAEIEFVSKSNNYLGPRMNISFLNRNTYHGAEILNVNMAGSFEAQFIATDKNFYSYSWNPEIELIFPRLVIPFNLKRTNSIYIPKTKFSFSYNFTKRVDYFDMHTLQFIYGFKWKNNIMKEHELNPVSISYSSILNKSVKFTSLLNSNPFLEKSYEEQFIAGASYSFTYNEQIRQGKKMQYYLNLTSEVAGNTLSLIKLIGGEKASTDNPLKVIGSVYSQFARLSIEGRSNYNINDKNKFVMRFLVGIAKPYGNSSVLPYAKQFFSGGPNSIRAFHINSVGPGTFNQSIDAKGFLQLGGDVKLEMNAEYRFAIFSFFKGALFADAGNVWLLESNPTNIGNPFSFSGFTNEIAMGVGLGLRIDVSFFVIRFDIATPFRKPWLEDNKWVIDKISLGNSSWRSENLVLNVAIGYPF